MEPLDCASAFRRHHKATVAWLASHIRRIGVKQKTVAMAGEQAEECVQDAWVRLLARGIKPEDRFPGLLMKVSMRAYGERVRQQVVAHKSIAMMAPREGVEPGWGAQLTPQGLFALLSRRAQAEVRAAARPHPSNRVCEWCHGSMEGMAPHARYCCRSHASMASQKRNGWKRYSPRVRT